MKHAVISLAAALVLISAAVAFAQTDPNYSNPPAQQPATTSQSTTTDQSTTTTTTTPSDQTTQTNSMTSDQTTLPATASTLPLVGLGGIFALTVGLWMSRPRRPRTE